MVEPSSTSVDWPSVLRAFRSRNKMTQNALANVLGVNQAAVSRWESGKDRPKHSARRRLVDLMRKEGPSLAWSWRKLLKSMPIPATINTNDFLVDFNAAFGRLPKVDFSPYIGKSMLGCFGDENDQRILEGQAIGLHSGRIAEWEAVSAIRYATPEEIVVAHIGYKSHIIRFGEQQFAAFNYINQLDEDDYRSFIDANDGWHRFSTFDDMIAID